MYIDKKKNVYPQKGKCSSIEKLFPRNANEWTHLVGIRISQRRLGSRRNGQSYASNQHRRENGFNHRHLSDLQFYSLPHEQSYYPPTREWSPAQLRWPTEAIGCHVTSKSQDQRLLSISVSQHALASVSNISNHRGHLLMEFPERNDETSLRFSQSFHGPYNLCGSCRRWFA